MMVGVMLENGDRRQYELPWWGCGQELTVDNLVELMSAELPYMDRKMRGLA